MICHCDHECNHKLVKIGCFCCNCHLGNCLCDGDKLAALRKAIAHCHDSQETTQIQADDQGWIWVVACLMREHFLNCKATPPAFNVIKANDNALAETRKSDSTRKVCGGKLSEVENREHVIKELTECWKKCMDLAIKLTAEETKKLKPCAPGSGAKRGARRLTHDDFQSDHGLELVC
jgi:hypothetical protein